jgi:type IV pilus assembly protein PilE
MKHGYSLLEVMIIIVMVSAFAAVAYPYWAQHVASEKRFEAEVSLTRLANSMEQYYVANNTYEHASLENLGLHAAVASGRYLLKIESVDNTDFDISAEPQGKQAVVDLGCGALTLNSAGQQGIRGKGDIKGCWG